MKKNNEEKTLWEFLVKEFLKDFGGDNVAAPAFLMIMAAAAAVVMIFQILKHVD